jgi:hypothetical protein
MTRGGLTDFGVGGAALTVPLWVQHLTEWAQVVLVMGSAALVLVRLCRALRQTDDDDGEKEV